jgi:transaldolase
MDLNICTSITTNPSIMANAKVDSVKDMIRTICGKYPIYDLSVELVDPFKSVDELVIEALEYYQIDSKKVVIKVPIIDIRTPKLLNILQDYEIPVNLTCVMSTYQAIMGLEFEPRYISFFYRRMVDFYENSRVMADSQISNAKLYQRKHKIGSNTEFICGSIRDPIDIAECFQAGTDIVTVPYKILLESFKHPKSEEAVLEFIKKWTEKDKVN